MKPRFRLLASLTLCAGALSAAAPLRAADPPGLVMASQAPAALFIRDVGRQFPVVLAGATTLAEKRERLTPFVERVVDVPEVARFCLGRAWTTATDAQRDRYQELFLKSLVNIIAARMATYQGGLGHVVVQAPVRGADGTTTVPTLVKGADSPEARVGWVVEADRTPMRVVDVIAEGMSLRLTKRSDFTAYLARHDGDLNTLLDALDRQTRR